MCLIPSTRPCPRGNRTELSFALFPLDFFFRDGTSNECEPSSDSLEDLFFREKKRDPLVRRLGCLFEMDSIGISFCVLGIGDAASGEVQIGMRLRGLPPEQTEQTNLGELPFP